MSQDPATSASRHDEVVHERMRARASRRHEPEPWTSSSRRAMVASAHYLATAAGVEVLERGGNAFDAAIATGVALAVVEPAGSGLGGMAMAMLHRAADATTVALQGACRAPMRATPEAVAAANRYRGHAAVAVPTYPAVLRHLHRDASLPLATLFAPAIRFAEDGFPLTEMQAALLGDYPKVVTKGALRELFVGADGELRRAGDRIVQPVLARTLRRLATVGLDDYYTGDIGRQIAEDMARNGGFVSEADFDPIPTPVERAPLHVGFGDDTVFTVGPPAGGITLVQMVRLVNALSPDRVHPMDRHGIVRLAAMIGRVRRDRKRYRLLVGAEEVEEAGSFLSDGYAQQTARRIERDLGLGETSHLSTMDAAGNAVAMTQSIERSFGAGVLDPELGFIYNGYLRAFKVQNKRHPHYLRPGAVARSNAAPTLVVRDGVAVAGLGSTGSERMVSGIFEVLLRLHAGESPFAAVHGPRLHGTADRVVLLERDRFPAECITALEQNGFTLDALEPYAFKVGGLQLVVRDGDVMTGVADPRRDGAAGGPQD